MLNSTLTIPSCIYENITSSTNSILKELSSFEKNISANLTEIKSGDIENKTIPYIMTYISEYVKKYIAQNPILGYYNETIILKAKQLFYNLTENNARLLSIITNDIKQRIASRYTNGEVNTANVEMKFIQDIKKDAQLMSPTVYDQIVSNIKNYISTDDFKTSESLVIFNRFIKPSNNTRIIYNVKYKADFKTYDYTQFIKICEEIPNILIVVKHINKRCGGYITKKWNTATNRNANGFIFTTTTNNLEEGDVDKFVSESPLKIGIIKPNEPLIGYVTLNSDNKPERKLFCDLSYEKGIKNTYFTTISVYQVMIKND